MGRQINYNLDIKPEDIMKKFGEQIKKNGVSRIYFVHGTWAGDSPLGFLSRNQKIPFNKQLRELVKINVDKAMGDLGNYTESYCNLFEQSIGGDIPCERINWGSGNFHSARVKGTIALIKAIAKSIENLSDNERILLIGHSHAGQLFALLTTFLESKELSLLEASNKISKVEKLVDVVGLDEEVYENIIQLKEDLQKIDKFFLDIVTFGTPPRYQWGTPKTKGDEENYRLLNIINHRYEPVSILGLLNTKDGDYVQQWGVGGTDVYDGTNSDIEKILGSEQYYISIDSVLTGEKRHIPKFGKTLLVDNGDDGENPIKSLLGHGLYTSKEKMLFNTELITNEFYKGLSCKI